MRRDRLTATTIAQSRDGPDRSEWQSYSDRTQTILTVPVERVRRSGSVLASSLAGSADGQDRHEFANAARHRKQR